MRFAKGLTLALVAGAALGLSACGGGNSEFASKIKESCEKSPQKDVVDCGCVANTVDKELDDNTKSLMLKVEAATSGGKSATDALKEAGISDADAVAMASKIGPAMNKAVTDCAKKS